MQYNEQEITTARELARAVKEEAMGGKIDNNFLIWQLAAAVERLANALVATPPGTATPGPASAAGESSSMADTWPLGQLRQR